MEEEEEGGWGRGRRRNDVESHLTIGRFQSVERRMLNVRTFFFSSNT